MLLVALYSIGHWSKAQTNWLVSDHIFLQIQRYRSPILVSASFDGSLTQSVAGDEGSPFLPLVLPLGRQLRPRERLPVWWRSVTKSLS